MTMLPLATDARLRATRLAGPRARLAAVSLAVALAADAGPGARGFCDVVFKDVVPHASVVVLADYHQPRDDVPYLTVVEVLKGRTDVETLRLGPHGLKVYTPRDGDQFLLALTPDHTLVDAVRGMGACTPISVLAIRGGKLRPRDREAYDGHHRVMTLDELRRDLRAGTRRAG